MGDKSVLKKEFQRAVEFINSYENPIPPDTLLQLYAYYKKGNNQDTGPGRKDLPLINAFKINALLQVQGLSEKQAMKKYIFLARKLGMPSED